MTKEEWSAGGHTEERGGAFGLGMPNDAYAKYFSGQSYLNILTQKGAVVSIYNVTFEPACRNNWHIHRAKKGGGQILICVAGEGWYQEEGKAARSLAVGDVVEIPANVKHWRRDVERMVRTCDGRGVREARIKKAWLAMVRGSGRNGRV